MRLDGHENLAMSLVGIFDSQIAGGKRYDIATMGRRRANATYLESHSVDASQMVNFAMDLTPLIVDDSLSPTEYVQDYIRRFAGDVGSKAGETVGSLRQPFPRHGDRRSDASRGRTASSGEKACYLVRGEGHPRLSFALRVDSLARTGHLADTSGVDPCLTEPCRQRIARLRPAGDQQAPRSYQSQGIRGRVRGRSPASLPGSVSPTGRRQSDARRQRRSLREPWRRHPRSRHACRSHPRIRLRCRLPPPR